MKTINKKKSVFMQMHEGTRQYEGRFNKCLQELFYAADTENSVKLVRAFPEFFGDEVPEFGITADKVKGERANSNV
ncbi:MAG: hypothetical protein LBF55_07565 [Prevotellaceae bacterium]|jgi:2-oxo-4-hydroxy-4-carboxy--5-ureidoimidazoline (OHCU) decarboxylase|nr:hypothetical protein [Prevotellaceae bacterium]